MKVQVIDVWNIDTFDFALLTQLQAHEDLIRDYYATDHQIFLSHDLGRGRSCSMLRPENPHADEFHALQESIGREMETRSIRAFHYTRLTDGEVADLIRNGIHLSTPATLCSRLDAIVAEGGLTRDAADKLYSASPFHSDQREARSGKFWMASHPLTVDDNGVVPLLHRWGGEVASMWIRNDTLLKPLASLGKPRVLEVAVPLSVTRDSWSAAQAVVAAFARSRGSIPSKFAFDLYVKEPLPGTAVLAVHTEGELSFGAIGRGYPRGFVDTNIGRWKELTGEDD